MRSILWLPVAGCALMVLAESPAIADPFFEAAIQKHLQCVDGAIVVLDDKISPADVIALAAERKCRSFIVADCLFLRSP
jgi:hypothetical protein